MFNTAISLSIFCLEDLSISDSGVLKSATIIVLLSIFFLKSSKIILIYLVLLYWVHICLQCLCLLDGFFPWIWSDLLGLFLWLFFWSLFCLIRVLLPRLFFFCLFAWKIGFQSFTFSLCRSFVLRWVTVGSLCVGHVFLSVPLFCVFWLGPLIHLHLRLSLIGTYSLPFLCVCVCACVPVSFFLFLKQSL